MNKTCTVVAFVGIGQSVLKLSENTKLSDSYNQPHKVVLQAEKIEIAYFMDGIDFGEGSLIKIKSPNFPLIFAGDWEVAEFKEPLKENLLLKKMIEKLKSEQM